MLPVADTKLAKAFEFMFFAVDLASELYRFAETLDRALIVRGVPLFLGPNIKIVYLDGYRGYSFFVRKIEFLGNGQSAAESFSGFLHLTEIPI
ncbi:MAG: hypothetical protein WAU81_04065 [Candidatus Aminicenantales bacterium]